jgi:polyribonucleotide nucleotidyltransferase
MAYFTFRKSPIERIANVADVLAEGQKVRVQVMDVDQRGRIKLSMKDIPQA